MENQQNIFAVWAQCNVYLSLTTLAKTIAWQVIRNFNGENIYKKYLLEKKDRDSTQIKHRQIILNLWRGYISINPSSLVAQLCPTLCDSRDCNPPPLSLELYR